MAMLRKDRTISYTERHVATEERELLRDVKRKITEKDLYACAMAWARYGHQWVVSDQVVTKCDCKADILVADLKRKVTIEVEIKNTKHDLCVLESKKAKYNERFNGGQMTTTDYYCLLVNPDLVATALEVSDKRFGVMTIKPSCYSTNKRIVVGGMHLTYVRNAKRLSNPDPFDRVLVDIALRASSAQANRAKIEATEQAITATIQAENIALKKALRSYFLT